MRFILTKLLVICIVIANAQSTITFTIAQPNVLEANAGNDTIICIGETIILGDLTPANGGNGNYTFNWSPNIGIDDFTLPNPTAVVTGNVNYILSVKDINGCISSDSIFITINSLPLINLGNDSVSNTNVELNAVGDYVSYLWSTESTESSIIAGETGEYWVVVSDSNNCEASDTINISILVSINLNADNVFSVYPNPNTGKFNIELKLDEKTKFELYNLSGALVNSFVHLKGDKVNTVNLPFLPKGQYILKATNSKGTFVKKITII
jgi:hypothetical protein